MTDTLLELALSNVCASAGIAVVALLVQRAVRQPTLAHALWLLALIRLLCPPLWTSPWAPLPSFARSATAPAVLPASSTVPAAGAGISAPADAGTSAFLSTLDAPSTLVAIWLVGCLAWLVLSLARVARFHVELLRAARLAPDETQRLARETGRRLGLRRIPEILTTPARISPFVWSIRGRVSVVLPRELLERFDTHALRMVLAHELAHVRRHDHLVRWVEWAACTAFWWNPIVWWARRHLRDQEELSCDLLVLERLGTQPRSYAQSLLSVAETLCSAGPRLPAFVSAMDSGGNLEKRLTMILSNRIPRTPRWVLSTAFVLGAALLPWSFVYAQDMDAIHKRLRAAVQAGEISAEQAKSMIDALRKSGPAPRKDQAPQTDVDPRQARLEQYGRTLREQVQQGKLTREQAVQKMEEAKKKMAASSDRPMDAPAPDAKKARYAEYELRLVEQAKSGEITREEMRQKLEAARQRMAQATAPKSDAPTPEAMKARYAEYERRLVEQAKAGEITREEMRQKLEAAKKRMAASQTDRAGGDAANGADMQARMQQVQQRLRAAVERGDMSPEEARKKLAELRAQWAGKQQPSDQPRPSDKPNAGRDAKPARRR